MNEYQVLRAAFDSATDGIVVIDNHGNVVDHNPKFNEIWKIHKPNLKGVGFNTLFSNIKKQLIDERRIVKSVLDFQAHPGSIGIDLIKLKDKRVLEFYSQPQKDNAKIVGRIWNFRDVTQRIQLQEKLKYQATHDALTGLPNQFSLNDYLEKKIHTAKQYNEKFYVLFFDMDRFKLINDSFNHTVGDEVLTLISSRIQNKIRKCDFLSRMSADKFILVLSESENELSINNIIHKLLNEISLPIAMSNHELIVTSSVGLAQYPKDGQSVKELLRNADSAVHRAKRIGINQIYPYHDKMYFENVELFERENELRRAIINNEFFICYQPQFEVMGEKLTAIEAFLRWQHPTKGVLSPADFLPLAEETGLIVNLSEWVMKHACEKVQSWHAQGLTTAKLSINISEAHFKQPNFVKNIVAILNEVNFKPENLELEIKESTVIGKPDLINTVFILKSLGIESVLDNFGTGYSSINFIRTAPFSRLKIDKSFIQNINKNKSDEIIISAIIDIAKSLSIQVLAEGVETAEQLDYLKSQRCGIIQGFYFSKPLTDSEFEKMLINSPGVSRLLIS